MVGYIEMKDPTTVIAENHEYKQDSEASCWHRKVVERDEFFGVILQESSPAVAAAPDFQAPIVSGCEY